MIKFVIKRNNPDDLLFTLMLIGMVLIYFGVSLYFAKKDRECQNPAKLEWQEEQPIEIWTGVDY